MRSFRLGVRSSFTGEKSIRVAGVDAAGGGRGNAGVTAAASDSIHVENPATGRPLGDVPAVGAAEVAAAVARARAAQPGWAALP
ncbi:MAG TPA: aldehyde dehydrogenase family protein, partial [Polyangia bacterium]|nr:aldehyde dehydrogenase family protein [Polyangia bacterium]